MCRTCMVKAGMDGGMDGERERGREGMDLPAAPLPLPFPVWQSPHSSLIFLPSVGPPYAFTENIIKEAKGALIRTSSMYIYLHCLLMRLSTLLHQSWICVDWLQRWMLVKIFVTHQLFSRITESRPFWLENIFVTVPVQSGCGQGMCCLHPSSVRMEPLATAVPPTPGNSVWRKPRRPSVLWILALLVKMHT